MRGSTPCSFMVSSLWGKNMIKLPSGDVFLNILVNLTFPSPPGPEDLVLWSPTTFSLDSICFTDARKISLFLECRAWRVLSSGTDVEFLRPLRRLHDPGTPNSFVVKVAAKLGSRPTWTLLFGLTTLLPTTSAFFREGIFHMGNQSLLSFNLVQTLCQPFFYYVSGEKVITGTKHTH